MAIKVSDEFGSRANPPSQAYPSGSLKDETNPGTSNDGSPLSSRVGNDFQGFMQSVLSEAGIDANGNPDSVENPQILNAIKKVQESHASTYTDIVFKATGVDSAFDTMVSTMSLNPFMYAVGTIMKTGGTTWEYIDSTGPITSDNFRVFDAVNVKDLGAKGDGSACADAFIKATGLKCNTIYVPDGNIFQIEKEVDLKFKNLVGGGGMSQGTSANGLSEITHPVGYTGALFSYPGAVVEDIYFRGNGGTATCFTRIGYNQEFKNNTFRVFDYALYSVGGVAGATVNLYVTGNFFSSNNTCFFSEDVNNNQSTTTYFHRNEFNFNDECIIFDKEVFGSSFTCNVFENVNVPIKGKAFYDCNFDTLWFEIVRDGATDKPIIVVTDEEQFARNTVGNLYLHPSSTWFNNISTDGTKAGGVFTTRDVLRVGNAVGGRVKIEDNYLRDDFNPFYGARRFGIKGSDQDPTSNLTTEVRLDHGSGGRLVFGHTDESRTTPVTHRRAIGPNAAGDGAYLGLDSWIANEERSWEAYDPDAIGPSGKFRALQYLVYNGSTVSAGGYTITKTSTGTFILSRESGGIPQFSNPALSISGIEVASGFLVHKVIVSGTQVEIFFADLSGALTNPSRFTVGFQNT